MQSKTPTTWSDFYDIPTYLHPVCLFPFTAALATHQSTVVATYMVMDV